MEFIITYAVLIIGAAILTAVLEADIPWADVIIPVVVLIVLTMVCILVI